MYRFAGLVLCILVLAATPAAAEEGGWFTSFNRVQVQPVDRTATDQLELAGTIETDGFSELVFSLGGEFKEGIPESGKVGALLIPDLEVAVYLLENEGYLPFPLEVTFDVGGLSRSVFLSEQQTARIAFPRYRVYFYNETTSGATMSLFVYRTR